MEEDFQEPLLKIAMTVANKQGFIYECPRPRENFKFKFPALQLFIHAAEQFSMAPFQRRVDQKCENGQSPADVATRAEFRGGEYC